MAITPNVSPTQEITNLFRTVFDGTRMFLSIGSTAVTKFSELLKATKLCKEKHALDKGGLMSLAQIKTLVDDVSNGRDTLCTATVKHDYVLMGYQIQIVCRFVHKYDLIK